MDDGDELKEFEQKRKKKRRLNGFFINQNKICKKKKKKKLAFLLFMFAVTCLTHEPVLVLGKTKDLQPRAISTRCFVIFCIYGMFGKCI